MIEISRYTLEVGEINLNIVVEHFWVPKDIEKQNENHFQPNVQWEMFIIGSDLVGGTVQYWLDSTM